jgi:hypothetical protein
MKYCLVETKRYKGVKYEIDLPFVYNNTAAMRSWFAHEAKHINLFDSIKEAKEHVCKHFPASTWRDFDVVPHDDILVMYACMKLKV